jgi:hypothetical protein
MLMNQILGHYFCNISLMLFQFGNSVCAAIAPDFIVVLVLVCFKDIFNKYFIKVNIIISTLNLMCINLIADLA